MVHKIKEPVQIVRGLILLCFQSGELQNRIAKSPGELSRPRDSLPVKLRDLEKSDQDVKAQSTIVNKLSDNLVRFYC